MSFRIDFHHLALVLAVLPLCACDMVEEHPVLTERVGKGAVPWLTNFDVGLARAREEGKPILLEFTGSDWCVWCQQLDREVFTQPQFQDYAKGRFILVEIDFPHTETLPEEVFNDRDALRQKFKVEEYPTVVVLNPGGEELGRFSYQKGGVASFVESVEKLIKPLNFR